MSHHAKHKSVTKPARPKAHPAAVVDAKTRAAASGGEPGASHGHNASHNASHGPDSDHSHDSAHDHSHAEQSALLSLLTVAGLMVGLVDRFWMPLPAAGVTAALGLAYLAGGVPAGLQALRELFGKGVLDIDLLMVIAALAAAAVGAPLEGAVLLALFSISGALEERAMGKAREAVEALMALRPEEAVRLEPDGSTSVVAVAEIVPGDRLILRPGARVPVDGRLIEGEGSVDESTITGEAEPVRKAPGAKLHEATVNLHGILTMEASIAQSGSTVARMIALVTEAQAMKAPSERFSQWFGARYTVAVLVGAVAIFVALLLWGADYHDALYRAATVLVAASPCAVVISVPAAILSALSVAARGGVLFKGGAALEMLAEVRAFAFDKTGTLTTGRAEVTGIVDLSGLESAAGGLGEAGVLALLAGIEAQSEHHIADAIQRRAATLSVVPVAVRDVVAHPSEGLTGRDAEGALWAGNSRMAARHGADLDAARALDSLAAGDQTVVYLGRGKDLLGAVSVADVARGSAAAGLVALRASGIARIVMMTGDRRAVALRIAGELGMDEGEVSAELLPADKVALVSQMAEGGRVAFVGDGVNDAAALARADVGIAMGVAGSEVALQAAEVALLSEDLSQLAMAHDLARQTAGIIRQNLIFALGAMIVLVVGGVFFELPLPLAVIGHEGGTLLVVMNGLRLLRHPIRRRG